MMIIDVGTYLNTILVVNVTLIGLWGVIVTHFFDVRSKLKVNLMNTVRTHQNITFLSLDDLMRKLDATSPEYKVFKELSNAEKIISYRIYLSIGLLICSSVLSIVSLLFYNPDLVKISLLICTSSLIISLILLFQFIRGLLKNLYRT